MSRLISLTHSGLCQMDPVVFLPLSCCYPFPSSPHLFMYLWTLKVHTFFPPKQAYKYQKNQRIHIYCDGDWGMLDPFIVSTLIELCPFCITSCISLALSKNSIPSYHIGWEIGIGFFAELGNQGSLRIEGTGPMVFSLPQTGVMPGLPTAWVVFQERLSISPLFSFLIW